VAGALEGRGALGLPCSSAARSATLQVVATVTIATYVGLGGLGFYIIQGIQLRDTAQILGASLLVVALGSLLDGSSPRPAAPRAARRRRRTRAPHAAAAAHRPTRRPPTRLPTSTAPQHPPKGTAPSICLARRRVTADRARPSRVGTSRTDGGAGDLGGPPPTPSDRVAGVLLERDHRRDLRAGPRGRRLHGRAQFNIGQRDAIIPSLRTARSS
jgi:hypothetical protein